MEFKKENNGYYYRDTNGNVLAELTYADVKPGVVDINHTYVDPSLRGQGAGKAMVDEIVDQFRQQGVKIIPTCPYVVHLFNTHDEYADVHYKTN